MSMKLFKTARGCTKRKAPEYSRIGTAHFTSLLAAQRYYAGYGYSAADVGCKLEMQEIFIGRPNLLPGDKLGYTDNGLRYEIQRPVAS